MVCEGEGVLNFQSEYQSSDTAPEEQKAHSALFNATDVLKWT
jgi:hypothetical protein